MVLDLDVFTGSWRQLIEHFPDAVICTDSNARIVVVNKAAVNLLSYTVEEFQQLELISLFGDSLYCKVENSPRAQVPIYSANRDDALKAGFDTTIKAKDGTQIPVLVSSNKIIQTGTGLPVHIAIIRDMRNLKEAQTRYEILFNNIHDAVFLAPIGKDGSYGSFVEVNDVACERLGYSREELLSLDAGGLNPLANKQKIKSFGQHVRREGRSSFETIHVTKDGTPFPVDVVAKVIEMEGQDYVLSMVKDLRDEHEVSKSQERFGKLLEHSWDEIYVFNSEELKFLQVNQGALMNLGYSAREMQQKKVTDIKPEIDEDQFREITRPLLEGSQSRIIFETTHQRKDGSVYPVEIRLQISHNEVPPVFLANVQDITQRKKHEEKLTYLANYDPLTGLPNRSLFMDRLNVAIENSKRSWMLNALMFLDLDGFKNINDTLGHDAGDILIKEVARRIQGCLRKSDTVYRMGGDEFTIIATNQNNVVGTEITARRIIEAVSAPVHIYGQEIQTSVSIGVTVFPFDDDTDAVQLLKQADTAMYKAKDCGKNNFQYFTAELARRENARVQIEHALKRALVNDEFSLVFQPRIDLRKGQVIGAEALLRWQNADLGPVFPDIFIPMLESTGAIKEVGHWVLLNACKQIKSWADSGVSLRVSINVSARQLEDEGFVEQVSEALLIAGVNATFLEIEITEGVLLSYDDHVLETLKGLREMGVTISLDDFGTGYSSLSYLKKYPIDILKIDRSFIKDLDQSEDNVTLVDTIISMARSLKMRVTAEGIEKLEHAEFLRQRECEEGQGYYFARPMKADEFIAALNDIVL